MQRIAHLFIWLLIPAHLIASDQSSLWSNVGAWLYDHPKTAIAAGAIASVYGVGFSVGAKHALEEKYAITRLEQELAKPCLDEKRIADLLTMLRPGRSGNKDLSYISDMCYLYGVSVMRFASAACYRLQDIDEEVLVYIMHAFPEEKIKAEVARFWGEKIVNDTIVMSIGDPVLCNILCYYPDMALAVFEQLYQNHDRLDASVPLINKGIASVSWARFGPRLMCLYYVVQQHPEYAHEVASLIAPYLDHLTEVHARLISILLYYENESLSVSYALLPYMQAKATRIDWDIIEAFISDAQYSVVASLASSVSDRIMQLEDTVYHDILDRCPEYAVSFVRSVCNAHTWRDSIWRHGTIRSFLASRLCLTCLHADSRCAMLLAPYAAEYLADVSPQVIENLIHNDEVFASHVATHIHMLNSYSAMRARRALGYDEA